MTGMWGTNFDAMRESVLCSNINHPNVVMTYKASPPLCIPVVSASHVLPAKALHFRRCLF